jgi:hypothetical protein
MKERKAIEMSDKNALQKAADEARKGARAARELGGFLDNYAKYLSQRDGRERAEETRVFALNRLSIIKDGLATCNKWVIESGKIVVAQILEQIITTEVSETQDTMELSKPRAIQIKKKEHRK